MDDWKERKHQEVFESVCSSVEDRRRDDPSFTRADLEGLLESHYVLLGNDHAGRGEPRNTIIAATIAAFEHCLAEWPEAESKRPEDALEA